jgi:aminodeoxyfutalosine synthase
MSSVLDEVGARVASGKAPSFEQLRALAGARDLVRVGMLGEAVRRRKHGTSVTYVRVADIAMSEAATAEWPSAAGELRLVGEPADAHAAAGAVRSLAARAGKVPVTAWSLATLLRISAGDAALVDLVKRLLDAGLAAVAEAPIDLLPEPVRAVSAVCKAGGAIARHTTHQPAADLEATLQRCQQVALLQRATGAVRSFAPLARAQDLRSPSTGYDDVKTGALARLCLDDVESIQVDWQQYGPKLAQVALVFGADDIDAVPAADGLDSGRRRATVEEIRRNITAASLTPVERDGRWVSQSS